MRQRTTASRREVQAAVKIQTAVRGWLARITVQRLRSKLLKKEIEDGLNYIESRFTKVTRKVAKLTPEKRKPPRYQKPLSQKQDLIKKVVTIQSHVRGYQQRKKYKELLIDKLLRDQEELFETQFRKVEEGLLSEHVLVSPTFSRIPMSHDLVRSSVPDARELKLRNLPMMLEERRHKSATFSPISNRKVGWKHEEFAFDVYILASIEIQRRYRGYRDRKEMGGSFWQIRRKVVKIQRHFRHWKSLRQNQFSQAARLLAKEAAILTSTFRSYQHLRSLLLTQDAYGRFAPHVEQVDEAVKRAGIYCDNRQIRTLELRIADLEASNRALSEELQTYRQRAKVSKSKSLNTYLKSLKTIKCQMELSFKSNIEQISALARAVLKDREDAETLMDESVDQSTRLP